jgi:hypothetical protein
MADRPQTVLLLKEGRLGTVWGRCSLPLRGDVSASRRFHINLPADLEADLIGFARNHGLGLGPAIRLLVGNALRADQESQACSSAAALAALTAAEHAVLMVASVLPEGQRRMRELAPQAATAAEARLALFREAGE